MQRRDVAEDNVVLMPLPHVDEEFWARIPSGSHPRALALKEHSWLWLTDIVRPSLNRTEAALATVVLLGTVWAGQTRFTGTYRCIQDFIPQIHEYFGLEISRSALSRAVRSLASCGLLEVHDVGQNGITLSLDLQWLPDE